MTQVGVPFDNPHADAGDVVVRRPRAGDAVGKALRQAFSERENATIDWRHTLRALDALR